jgi:unconventional prefoldin RPB5 interactor 1
MDLEEGSELSDGDYLDDEELEEDENDTGRHVIGYNMEELEDTGFEMDDVRQELTPEYIQEMEALVRKYNQPVTANVGPRDAGFPLATSLDPPVRKVKLSPEPPASNGASKLAETKSSGKKGVRFAEELDIASESPPSTLEAPVQKQNIPVRPKEHLSSDAIMSDIVERAPAPMYTTENAGGKKKVSRFKASRSS